jgi:competence protein ComEA
MKQTLWKEYFNFSKQERTGITVLLILISICVSAPAAWEYFHPPMPENNIAVKAAPHIGTPDQRWIRLENTSRKRLYGKKWITTVSQRDTTWTGRDKAWTAREKTKTPPKLSIDINTADSTAWTTLPGIGPVLAARIIRFRNKLGGFYAISQVKETYGLPDSTFVKIQSSLQLNTVSLNNLDINLLDEQSLAKHPYIRYKLARLIVLYRNNNGPFRSTEELLGIPLVDDSIYRKLEPYIKTIK